VATVREKGRGGQRKARTVFISPRTVAALRQYLDGRSSDDAQPVFWGQRGPLTTSGVFQRLKRLARTAQIHGRSNPHAFRHGFVRGALQNGADLSTVARLVGHSNVGITAQFYARWTEVELKEKHDRVSWLPEMKGDEPATDGRQGSAGAAPTHMEPSPEAEG
jgi:integrase/recombinase XerD